MNLRSIFVAAVICLGLYPAAEAQTGNTVICYRYTDVSNGQVKTEFGYLSPNGVFTATSTYNNPTSICTVDTLTAISGKTVVDKPLWDANAASFSQSFSITGVVYEVQGNPCYIIQALNVATTSGGSSVNISTRANVGSGSDVLIAGFIIQGTAPKKVLIRVSGPSLTKANLSGVLSNPALELHDSAGAIIGRNDDWQTTILGGVIAANQVAEIDASALKPNDPLEPAILATLDPGTYTAVVSGAGTSSGIGVVELYDVTGPTASKLVNISTRGSVQPGDNGMIGGFIISGPPATVVIRGMGPSLANAGIANTLTDPNLSLYDASGTLIGHNDDWHFAEVSGVVTSGQAAALQSLNLAPGDFNEAAMKVTLPAGNYTALVHGSGASSGVGLVEVYTLP